MTKAMLIIRILRRDYGGTLGDAGIVELLQIADDQDWDRFRQSAGVKPHKPTMTKEEDGTRTPDTSSSVSRSVKALIYLHLRSTMNPGVARPGRDALTDRRLRVVRDDG